MLALALAWAVPLRPAAADHDDGAYEIASHANWDHGDLSVLIIPPAHGQIYNFETGVLGGGDPTELTPFNSYLEAIEGAIAAWDDAINLLGADWLKEYYEPTVYVLGRDTVPPEVLAEPDVLVVTDENEGPLLGTAIWGKTGYVHTPCIVRMSSTFLASYTVADMYNVTAQEYGHCLGLGHVGSQGGVDPTSEQKHPEHDVMNGFYPHFIGDPGTHLHCVSNLDVLALEHVFDYELPYSGVLNLGVEGVTLMPVEAYGDACVSPPSDWRAMTPPTLTPGAAPMRSSIDDPIDDSSVTARDFKRAYGGWSVDDYAEDVEADHYVAFAAVAADGSCTWWDESAAGLRARDCHSPLWMDSDHDGTDRWKWKAPSGLPPGRYRVVSRIVTEYGNEPIGEANSVDFTLTPARAKKKR